MVGEIYIKNFVNYFILNLLKAKKNIYQSPPCSTKKNHIFFTDFYKL